MNNSYSLISKLHDIEEQLILQFFHINDLINMNLLSKHWHFITSNKLFVWKFIENQKIECPFNLNNYIKSHQSTSSCLLFYCSSLKLFDDISISTFEQLSYFKNISKLEFQWNFFLIDVDIIKQVFTTLSQNLNFLQLEFVDVNHPIQLVINHLPLLCNLNHLKLILPNKSENLDLSAILLLNKLQNLYFHGMSTKNQNCLLFNSILNIIQEHSSLIECNWIPLYMKRDEYFASNSVKKFKKVFYQLDKFNVIDDAYRFPSLTHLKLDLSDFSPVSTYDAEYGILKLSKLEYYCSKNTYGYSTAANIFAILLPWTIETFITDFNIDDYYFQHNIQTNINSLILLNPRLTIKMIPFFLHMQSLQSLGIRLNDHIINLLETIISTLPILSHLHFIGSIYDENKNINFYQRIVKLLEKFENKRNINITHGNIDSPLNLYYSI